MESVLPAGEVAERFAEPVPSPALLVSPCAAIRMLIQRLPAERPSSGFLDTPLEECERRDVKGLCARARRWAAGFLVCKSPGFCDGAAPGGWAA